MRSAKFTHFFSSLLCRKNKADLEMSEGVGNPVYDTFNEGQPLEDVSYFIHLKAWTVSWLSSSFFQLYQLRVLVRSGT